MKVGVNDRCPCGSGKKYKKCCMDENEIEKQKLTAWEQAEVDYEMVTMGGNTFFGFNGVSTEDEIKRYEDIVSSCPNFYPAIMSLGLEFFKKGDKEKGEKKIEEGFNLMLELASSDNLEKELDIFVSNLERLFEFGIAKKYLGLLSERFPENVNYYDSLAYIAIYFEDYSVAVFGALRAVELSPDNLDFKMRLAQVYLYMGDFDKARVVMEVIRGIDSSYEDFDYYFDMIRYLEERGGGYLDYMLRFIEDKIEKLNKEDRFEEAERIGCLVNSDRLDAFEFFLFREKKIEGVRLFDIKEDARVFFNFVKKVDGNGVFLVNDNLDFLQENFRAIMHKFIFKMGDVDERIMEGVYESVSLFYEMLVWAGLVLSERFEDFKDEIFGMREELMRKMYRYNEIRHDDSVSEDDKDAIREELFEGDHGWQFL